MDKFDKINKVADIILVISVMLLAVVASAALWSWLLDRPWSLIASGFCGVLIGVITDKYIKCTLNKYKEV